MWSVRGRYFWSISWVSFFNYGIIMRSWGLLSGTNHVENKLKPFTKFNKNCGSLFNFLSFIELELFLVEFPFPKMIYFYIIYFTVKKQQQIEQHYSNKFNGTNLTETLFYFCKTNLLIFPNHIFISLLETISPTSKVKIIWYHTKMYDI